MKAINNPQTKYYGGLLAADLLFFGLTDSTKVSSPLIMIGYLLAVATIFSLFLGLSSLLRLYGLPIKRQKRVAAYLTLVTGLLLALQSTGQLGTRDLAVIMPLALISYAYINYAKNLRRNEA